MAKAFGYETGKIGVGAGWKNSGALGAEGIWLNPTKRGNCDEVYTLGGVESDVDRP